MTDNPDVLDLDFDPDAVAEDAAFRVQFDDYQGPLDMLLDMARGQRVDLAKISVLHLADQYIQYIETAKSLRIEVAADYLVMAAWLTYLKSRLLLPKEEEVTEEPSAKQMADALAFQLQRLQAMKQAANDLFERPQLGRDIFVRTEPEGFTTHTRKDFRDTLYDLLAAYADHEHKQRNQGDYRPATPYKLYTLDEALERIGVMFGARGLWRTRAWISLQDLLSDEPGLDCHSVTGKSLVTSLFSASLELAKAGQIDIQQQQNFGPIYLRAQSQDQAQEEAS